MADLFEHGALVNDLAVTDVLDRLTEGADQVFVKLLSRNDCSWADGSSNQAGFYVPKEIRMSGFFPDLVQRKDIPHIFDTDFDTLWPVTGVTKESHYVHYSNKGPEAHITRIPKEEFAGLGPASLLVIARRPDLTSRMIQYQCITIDSASPDYDLAFDYLQLPPDFEFGIIQWNKRDSGLKSLIDELLEAILEKKLDLFIEQSQLPSTLEMSRIARDHYARSTDVKGFNPFLLEEPGNLIADIVKLEYEDFKQRELRLRVAEIASSLVERKILAGDNRSVIGAIVDSFEDISIIFKSMRGSRATRAGTSFELHIKALLEGGKIPHHYQALVGRRTPDFILPSLQFYELEGRVRDAAIILTAKTTLRERWQQILNEGKKVASWHLATLDKTVTKESLDEMEELGVILVVPEALKINDYTLYTNRKGVITFRDFFRLEVKMKLPKWN